MSESDVNKMKVADLKRELKMRGLVTTGNKTELQDRLTTALLDGEISLEDPSGEFDESVLTDEDEGILGSDENELLKSPKTQISTTETNNIPNDDIVDIEAKPTKVILKRNNSIKLAASNDVEATNIKENAEPPPEKIIKKSTHTPITMSDNNATDNKEENGDNSNKSGAKQPELSLEERLAIRAKKFGIAAVNIKEKTEKEQEQIDILKKRAERFGCVTSSKIVKICDEEKLLKRKERFGLGKGNTSVSVSPVSNETNEYAEKARLRTERFKTAEDAVVIKKKEPITAPSTTL